MAGKQTVSVLSTSFAMLSAVTPIFCLGLLLLLWSAGCKKKADITTEVSQLEKAFPTAVATGQPTPPAAPANPTSSLSRDPNPMVQSALRAVRANDYAQSVIALQAAQNSSRMTPEQFAAVEKAKQAITADLLVRAGRGDPKALADLAAIEKTRSQ